MNTSFLSLARACSGPRVIKKVPWAGQGRLPKRHPLYINVQNRIVTLPSDQAITSPLEINSSLKSMETMLRVISNDIWASLGPGYSESVYHCAFEVALRAQGLYYETERIVPVFYAGQNVGHVRADLIVDRKAVIELKSVSKLNETYRIQTQNYLKLLDLQEGYLINFPDKKGACEFETITRDKPVDPPLDVMDC